MRSKTIRLVSMSAGLCLLTLATAGQARNDFPTLTRVEYVMGCLKLYNRPVQELIYKCSCAIDRIAEEVDNDTWIGLLTYTNARPMAGERGAYVRERKDIRTHIDHHRALEEQARKACFLPPPTNF